MFDQFFTTCIGKYIILFRQCKQDKCCYYSAPLLSTDVSQKSRRSLRSKNEAVLTSPSNVAISLPSISQNSSLQKLTDSTPKVEEIKGLDNDSSVLSPIKTTESAKGTINTQSTICTSTNAPTATDYGNSPHSMAGDLTSSPLTQGLTKHHHPGYQQIRKQRFNIITGHPLQQESDSAPTFKSSPSFTSSLNKIDSTNDLNSSKSSCTARVHGAEANIEQLQKAPHLDMRQTDRNRFQKTSSFSSMSTYRASFKPIPGFYSTTSTANVGSVGIMLDASAAMNYSRHSVPHNLKMSKSAPQSKNLGGSDSSLLG